MPKKAAGGPRDSVISVRLPARLRYGVELISRLNREPMTDVIVRAIDQGMTAEHGGLLVDLPGEDLPVNLLPKVWDEREGVRLVKLALVYPVLLTAAEKALWARIREEPRYWDGKAKKGRLSIDDLRAERLVADWAELRTEASGK